MRQSDNPMRNVDWHDWVEEIDESAYAVVSMAEEVYHGNIFQASTMLLVPADTPRHRARQGALEKLVGEMRSGSHLKIRYAASRFGMPMIGKVRDLRR